METLKRWTDAETLRGNVVLIALAVAAVVVWTL